MCAYFVEEFVLCCLHSTYICYARKCTAAVKVFREKMLSMKKFSEDGVERESNLSENHLHLRKLTYKGLRFRFCAKGIVGSKFTGCVELKEQKKFSKNVKPQL